MSICPKITKEDLINLAKLAKRQNVHSATKLQNGILLQTHDNTLAESFSPLTKKF